MKRQEAEKIAEKLQAFIGEEGRLYDLPAHQFGLGGEFNAVCEAAGYWGGRQCANDLNLWSMSARAAVLFIAEGLDV